MSHFMRNKGRQKIDRACVDPKAQPIFLNLFMRWK